MSHCNGSVIHTSNFKFFPMNSNIYKKSPQPGDCKYYLDNYNQSHHIHPKIRVRNNDDDRNHYSADEEHRRRRQQQQYSSTCTSC